MALSSTDPLVQAYSSARSLSTKPVPFTAERIDGQTGHVTPLAPPAASQPAQPALTPAPAATPAPQAGQVAASGEFVGGEGQPYSAPGITDPYFKGVQAGFQYQDDTLRQNASNDRFKVQQNLDFYLPEIAYQGGLQRRGISTDAEGRGILRSGEHARRLAEQQHAEQQSVAQSTMAAQQQQQTIEQQLATQQADLRRQYATQLQTTAGNQYLQQQQQAAQQAVIDKANGANTSTAAPAGAAVGADGNPITFGTFQDDQGNYYVVNNGKIQNVGWDVVNQYGTGAFQLLGSANSKDFRTAAGVTW